MSHAQSRPPKQQYVPLVPRPGSLQEWLIRALEVRAAQNQPDRSETPPAEPAEPEILLADAGQAPSDEPADPVAYEAPAEPERANATRGIQPMPIAAAARVDAIRTRAKIIAVVAAVAAALAVAVGWQSGGQAALGATAAHVTAPVITRPVRPAVFGEVVTLNGWQVKIAGLRNTPPLNSVPGLTTAAYPRALRMSVTLVNASDHALAADSWALSATANGTTVQLLTYPPDAYAGVPNQMLQPGASIVLPVAVAVPANWADLAIEAVHAQDAVAMTFTGRG
jgi:hypothetical protein